MGYLADTFNKPLRATETELTVVPAPCNHITFQIQENYPDSPEQADNLYEYAYHELMVDHINKLDQLEGLIQVQSACAWDDYMQGMANGLILALAVMTNSEPQFIRNQTETITLPAAYDGNLEMAPPTPYRSTQEYLGYEG